MCFTLVGIVFGLVSLMYTCNVVPLMYVNIYGSLFSVEPLCDGILQEPQTGNLIHISCVGLDGDFHCKHTIPYSFHLGSSKICSLNCHSGETLQSSKEIGATIYNAKN